MTHEAHPGFLVSPEERLLVLMSFSALEPDEVALAHALAPEVRSWDEVWSLADLNATAPLVLRNLERTGLVDRLPGPVRERFVTRAASVRAANEARLVHAKDLFARFGRRGIPVVILKGVLLAETVYRDPCYKRMNDVDILVRKQDLDAIYAIYAEMKLFSAAELIGGSARKQEKFSHHAPPFFSRDLKCMIGTHWGLVTPLAPYRLDYDAIWSRVVDIGFHGVPAKSMAAEDNLHHLCIHLPYYKTGVRELADIYNLIRHEGPRLDWALFLREVERAGTENLVYHALSLANRLAPTSETAEAIRRVEPRVSAFFRADTGRKTERLGRLLRSRSTHLSRIDKAFADCNASGEAGEKLDAYIRMWRHILAPPADDVARMSSLERPGPLELLRARVEAPARIFRVLARDVGAVVVPVVLAKTALDVVRAALRAPFGGNARPKKDHAAFAREIGVTVAELERVKDALE